MKTKLKIILLSLTISILGIASDLERKTDHTGHVELDEHDKDGHENHNENDNSEIVSEKIGPDKAIVSAKRIDGLKFSETAIKTLGLSYVQMTTNNSIPESAVIYSQDKIGIYRLRNGYNKFIEIKLKNKSSTNVTIQENKDITIEDKIAISGVSFIRNAEIDLNNKEDVGHGH